MGRACRTFFHFIRIFLKWLKVAQLRCYTILLFCQCVTPIKNKFITGDVLFGKLRPNLKKYIFANFEGVCSSEIWVLKGKKILSEYLFFLIQTTKFYCISIITFGSKMPRADWDFISSFPFDYPSIPEQQKIADCLTALDKKIEAVAQQIHHIEQFKKGLLQKMFV